MTAAKPRHALHAMTPFQLAGYRRQLESALAFFARQQPVPPVHADLRAALREVTAVQDTRRETARD